MFTRNRIAASLAAIRRIASRGLAVIAFGAAGLGGVSGQALAQGHGAAPFWQETNRGPRSTPDYSARAYSGCTAGARTLLGVVVRDTRERIVRNNLTRACEIALQECRESLDRKRVATGKPYRNSRCKVLKREPRVAAPAVEYRCVAQGFSARGGVMSGTRAAAVRADERLSCDLALARCEDRLDAKRYADDRSYRYARCEVTRSRQIAGGGGLQGWRDVQDASLSY